MKNKDNFRNLLRQLISIWKTNGWHGYILESLVYVAISDQCKEVFDSSEDAIKKIIDLTEQFTDDQDVLKHFMSLLPWLYDEE